VDLTVLRELLSPAAAAGRSIVALLFPPANDVDHHIQKARLDSSSGSTAAAAPLKSSLSCVDSQTTQCADLGMYCNNEGLLDGAQDTWCRMSCRCQHRGEPDL
jgi:hypothetical protein